MKKLSSIRNACRSIMLISVLFFLNALNGQSQNAPKTLSPAAPEVAGFSTQRLARLDSAMSDWVKKEWVNGSVAFIARKGKVVFHKSYGYNDPRAKEPLDKNGIFRIASQTKAITSVAAMMLWEEGKFSLEDPVSKFIPSFANQTVLAHFNHNDSSYTTVPAKRPITIRDLLTHTSGLGYPAIGTPEAKIIYYKSGITSGLGADQPYTMAQTMEKLGAIPLMFQPGEKWMYGVNTDLLGYLVELWSGMSLDKFFSERIFKPLGMNDTYFVLPSSKAGRLVNFFEQAQAGGPIQKQDKTFGGAVDMNYPNMPTGYFSGGGGLSSTIYDYAIFLQMLLNKGQYKGVRYLSHNTIRMMTMNQIGDLFVTNTENKFGLGFYVITENGSRLGPGQAGTYGWGGAFSTTYWIDPKEEMLVLLYRQMWGPGVGETDKVFRPLVYQAIND